MSRPKGTKKLFKDFKKIWLLQREKITLNISVYNRAVIHIGHLEYYVDAAAVLIIMLCCHHLHGSQFAKFAR